MTRRRVVLVVVAVVAVLGAVLVLSEPREDRYQRPALDPRGTGPAGTAALVALVRAEGATVRLGGQPDGRDDVVLQLRDTFSGDAADGLAGWVRDGGTLVVTDPDAALAPARAPFGTEVAEQPGACALDALADVDRLRPGLPTAFAAEPGTTACFSSPAADGAGVVVRGRGRGLVAGVANSVVLTNDALDDADNAVLARALLVPRRGVQVRVLDPNRFTSDEEDVGDGTVLGALPLRGSQAVTQLVIAFIAWGLVRGRRLGAPVVEELPVPLPASDLVLASGHLLDRNGDTADAAARLRRAARRDLGVAVGLGPDPPPHELAAALEARAGVDRRLVADALLAPVADGDALVATSAHLDRLRRELYQ